MPRSILSALLLILLVTFGAGAERLTLERIFDDPGLSGPGLHALRISPDGERVTFLRAKETDKDRLDLWEYNVDEGVTRLLVDSDVLAPEDEELSEEEAGRRERKRIAALKGIVEYDFSEDGENLLFPLGGDLYTYDLTVPGSRATRRLTDTPQFETDARFSPKGTYVSFVRDQDIFVIDGATGEETQLTQDGEGAVKNGMAEFIAQEEMSRHTGYWWSDDESMIAFVQVDESPVDVVRRYEIHADSVTVREQRYPAAGTANVSWKLGLVGVFSGGVRWLDLGTDGEVYLARVKWFPDSRHLAVQIIRRNQKSLELLEVDTRGGHIRRLLTERSRTWIDLHDDFEILEESERFIWKSARSGYDHLYLYGWDGSLIRQVTSGDWLVTKVHGVDESNEAVYFTATETSPLERHLYRASFKADTGVMSRVTGAEGWHAVTMSEDAKFYIDRFSDPRTPPRTTLHESDGSLLTTLLENRPDEDHPYYPYLDSHCYPEFGTLAAADGQILYYSIMKPPDFDPSRRYPVIDFVYGGPSGQTVQKRWDGGPFGFWTQFMAQRGYIIFRLDNRGTNNRGVAFHAPICRRLGTVEVEDQVAGVEFLRTLPYVDPERIGIYGWSYGGYAVLMAMLKAPDHFASGVSGAPVTDWALYDTFYTERYMGRPEENPEGYRTGSVFPYVDNLRGELLIIHGMADDNVLFSNSSKLFKALQEAGKIFEMMTYPGSKHSLVRRRETGFHALKTMTAFFDRTLKRRGE